MSRILNINNYTLIEPGDIVSNIYFYPSYAMTNQVIRSKKRQICVLFELRKEKEASLYSMYTYLLDKEGNKVFHAYSLYLREIEKYKYVILKSKNDANHADVIKKEIINFNTLDYNSFIDILSNNAELAKMVPDLVEALEEKAESLIKEKKEAKHIDIPNRQNYYQNVIGYLINEIEEQITTEDEIELSREILKNIKKNFEVVLYDKYQLHLAYISVYATILDKVRSTHLNVESILEAKDLKTDTNKTSLECKDLDTILNSFINNLKEEDKILEDLNIVQERIEYILTTKPKLKEITKYIKIILIDDKYVDPSRRNRSIDELTLKELIMRSFANFTYRPLPRNQVLLYTEENSTINFIAIVSLDMIYDLFKTFRLNTDEDNKFHLEVLNTIDNIISKNQKKKSERTLSLNITTILHLLIYNYKNLNSKILLFDKGQHILKLDYNAGAYDIKIIDRITEKKDGKVCKFDEAANELVRKSLNKGEKSFNTIINKIILQSIEASITKLNYKVNIKELSNSDIFLEITKPSKNNYFECNFNIGEFLLLISLLKKPKVKNTTIEDEEVEEIIEEEPVLATMSKEEKEYILRKAKTIVDIMNTKPLNNEDYYKVVDLYAELEGKNTKETEAILEEIKKLI